MKNVLIICALLTACQFAGAQQKQTGSKTSPETGISIWYLGHCGYTVQTKNHLLIFDYQEFRDGRQPKSKPSEPALDNGWINTEEIKDLSVHVFVSHSHSDHFDPVIFKWKEQVADIHYYLGWKADFAPSFNYLEGPHAVLKNDGMEITTINSHHSGVPEVAWLVKVDGVVIYHNGDCQPEDPVGEYAFLGKFTDHIDIAFVAPTYEESQKYTIQNIELFKRFSPGLVFPMHVTAGDKMYTDFAVQWKAKMSVLNIAIPTRMGDKFLFEKK